LSQHTLFVICWLAKSQIFVKLFWLFKPLIVQNVTQIIKSSLLVLLRSRLYLICEVVGVKNWIVLLFKRWFLLILDMVFFLFGLQKFFVMVCFQLFIIRSRDDFWYNILSSTLEIEAWHIFLYFIEEWSRLNYMTFVIGHWFDISQFVSVRPPGWCYQLWAVSVLNV
jgi:hypothetical protein